MWTPGFTNVTVAGLVGFWLVTQGARGYGGWEEHGVSPRGWDCEATVMSITSAFRTLIHWEMAVW